MTFKVGDKVVYDPEGDGNKLYPVHSLKLYGAVQVVTAYTDSEGKQLIQFEHPSGERSVKWYSSRFKLAEEAVKTPEFWVMFSDKSMDSTRHTSEEAALKAAKNFSQQMYGREYFVAPIFPTHSVVTKKPESEVKEL